MSENSGCDSNSSDRRAAPPAANYRQVLCSSTILHPLLSLDLPHSLQAAQRTQYSVHSSPKVKIQGASMGGAGTQSRAAVSRGIAEVHCRRGPVHFAPGRSERWEAQTLSRGGHCSQTAAGRPGELMLQARWRPPAATRSITQST